MASSSFATMKMSLVLMLLLSGVVASHGHLVSCKNSCTKPIIVNDCLLEVNAEILVEVVDILTLVIFDGHGKKHTGKYKCPEDVRALEFLYLDLYVKVKITAIKNIGGLLHSLLGNLINILRIDL